MRLTTLYLVRLHVPPLLGAAALLALVLVAGALLPVAEHIPTLTRAAPVEVAAGLGLRSALAALPYAVLVATLSAGLGLRARGERVALVMCGVRRSDRLAVAVGVGLAVALVTAEAGRALTPRLRQVERQLRGSTSAAAAAGLLERLESSRSLTELSVYVDRVSGQRLEGVVLWRAPGLPRGHVVQARAASLCQDDEPGRVVLELEDATLLSVGAPVLGSFHALAADRLTFTLRVDGLGGGPPRAGESSVDLLWAAREAGTLWRTDRIDRELSERAAEALLALAMALAGFAIVEVTPARRDVMAWLGGLAVAALPIVGDPLGRGLGLGAPWLPVLLVGATGTLALAFARPEDE